MLYCHNTVITYLVEIQDSCQLLTGKNIFKEYFEFLNSSRVLTEMEEFMNYTWASNQGSIKML